MLVLQNAEYQIIIQNDDTYTPKSSDNKYTYEKEYFFGSEKYAHSQYSVTVKSSGAIVHTGILLASSGLSGVHNHSATLHKDLCLVAIGSHLVALRVPVLDVEWATQVDTVTCFGVYHSAKYSCFLSHGELEISRVSYRGVIEWQCSGKDIFSNGFEVFEDHIIAVDFNDERYRIEIGTGKNRLVK